MLTMSRATLPAALGIALMVSSCASSAPTAGDSATPGPSEEPDAVSSEEPVAEETEEPSTDESESTEDRSSQKLVDVDGSVELQPVPAGAGAAGEVHHLRCDDEDALAEKAEHNGGEQPAGWPQDAGEDGDLPDPYCHPDYLEVGEWEHLESHFACWEGIETSTMVDAGQSQEEIDAFLWEQSEARAEWEPVSPGATCAEQWADHDGGDPEDYADIGNADDG